GAAGEPAPRAPRGRAPPAARAPGHRARARGGEPPSGAPGWRSGLERRFVELLEALLEVRHELVRVRPVHDAVVEAQREVAHGPDGDGVVAHDRALLD